MKELLHGKNLEDLPQEHQDNLSVLLERINKVRALWGKPITVTSCQQKCFQLFTFLTTFNCFMVLSA